MPCENKTSKIYEHCTVDTTKLSSHLSLSASWTRYWYARCRRMYPTLVKDWSVWKAVDVKKLSSLYLTYGTRWNNCYRQCNWRMAPTTSSKCASRRCEHKQYCVTVNTFSVNNISTCLKLESLREVWVNVTGHGSNHDKTLTTSSEIPTIVINESMNMMKNFVLHSEVRRCRHDSSPNF